ncbi:MAG: hypothetical protein HFI92_06735 [Lachnospiraceae bacterium]|nr:hypothetical protein [Lachnospiraceae bacterium]
MTFWYMGGAPFFASFIDVFIIKAERPKRKWEKRQLSMPVILAQNIRDEAQWLIRIVDSD